MTVTVISSCYGQFDTILVPPEQTSTVDRWLMVTDDFDGGYDAGWDVLVQPRPWVHPRFAAKHAKAQPFDYTDADIAVWLDAGAVIQSRQTIEWLVDELGDHDMAMWLHPERNNVYDEATCSAAIGKYEGQHCRQQAEHYQSQGLPDVLWATGCIVWRNTDANRLLGRMWLSEMLRWSLQDQLSFPYVSWRCGIRPTPLNHKLWRNPYVRWRGH